MKVLLVGGGGREHALAWRLRQEDSRTEIFAAPGNPGIAELATCVPIGATDVDALATFARQAGVDWTLVGPEAPLAAGLVDRFRADGMPIFGPTRAAAMLETSKAFSKSLMLDAGVPTARAVTCETLYEAERAIAEIGAPLVVKASGLAAGKGVIICQTAKEALHAATSMLSENLFGDAGNTILIEEFMEGEELSMFFVTDGEFSYALPPAQDHKRLLDGDRGPNTGGMGAYSPVALAPLHSDLFEAVFASVVRPTLEAMRARGTPFTGLLYAGLMLTDDGPRVVEFNCRFGDPETQVVLPALQSGVPMSEYLAKVARGESLQADAVLTWQGAALTTVLAASGYPEKPRTGDRIDIPPLPDDVVVFHAGTKRDAAGYLVTAGGRVLAVTGLGDSVETARDKSQELAAAIQFEGKQYRSDIGWRELARRAEVAKGAGAT
ncbi:MAG TPA: phosphoribosylamine--glycine ligase [Gemmatimonadaceae bacterium]|jgi:phosphoribosylamine--glycine ligase|nr:phosphoribosylamine--glycine ligase [Gemmatimonadaceae bacterium]